MSVAQNIAYRRNIPFPAPIKVTAGIVTAAEWKRFIGQWQNDVIATDLERESKAKRAAILLSCIVTEAYEIFETLDLSAEDKKDVDRMEKALGDHCIGETNVTYERYLFNQRIQKAGESFDAFFADLRRLIRTCDFGELQDSFLSCAIVSYAVCVTIRLDASSSSHESST